MNPKLSALYSLKFNPFRPDLPVEALYCTPEVDAFLRRVELGIADGGYVMITGDPGTGKTVALRLLAQRLERMRDVVVGTIEHPQSRTLDFYRELGDLFGVPLAVYNRWSCFKALRARWTDHISTSLTRPDPEPSVAQAAAILRSTQRLRGQLHQHRRLIKRILRPVLPAL